MGEKLWLDEDDWSFSFTDLPQLPEDLAFDYSVGELSDDGTPVQDGGYVSLDGSSYQVEVEETEDSYIIKNILDVIEVNGNKTWDDNEDKEGNRPASITIRLYADGTEIDNKKVTADDNWKWSFTNLDKYTDEGVEIVYTITEDKVSGYTTTVNGYNVTNTRQTSGGGSSGGGSGSGGSSGGGSGVGGPGDSGGSGGGDIWNLLPLPQTGQGWAMLIGVSALLVSAIALIVLLWYKRRETKFLLKS